MLIVVNLGWWLYKYFIISVFFFLKVCIYLFEKERAREGKVQREGEERGKQTPAEP